MAHVTDAPSRHPWMKCSYLVVRQASGSGGQRGPQGARGRRRGPAPRAGLDAAHGGRRQRPARRRGRAAAAGRAPRPAGAAAARAGRGRVQ